MNSSEEVFCSRMHSIQAVPTSRPLTANQLLSRLRQSRMRPTMREAQSKQFWPKALASAELDQDGLAFLSKRHIEVLCLETLKGFVRDQAKDVWSSVRDSARLMYVLELNRKQPAIFFTRLSLKQKRCFNECEWIRYSVVEIRRKPSRW